MDRIQLIKNIGKTTNVFYFKQFRVKDDQSTMKVGTDGILLGIAAKVEGAEHILEVGTGCGVIALALAQRSSAIIDALEIDPDSVAQARENVASSPWKDRIDIIHCPLQEFNIKKKYDLIVSNPPFFSGTFKSHQNKRNISRHNESLPFADLISHSDRMLADNGSLWVILPVKESLEFIDIAESNGFYTQFLMKIIPKAGKEYNRLIIQLNREETDDIRVETLTHWLEDGKWSQEFKNFTGEFYIDF